MIMGTLHPHEDPIRRCLKVPEWPEWDQRLWVIIFQPGDILDGDIGAGFHWKEATRQKYRKGYGRWLTFLITTHQFDAAVPPTDRITPERVTAYMEQLRQDIAPWTVWGRVAELLAVAKAFAPDHDWSWLRRIVRYLETNSQDSKNKQPRLRPAAEIAAWAYQRMDAIITNPPDRDPASRYRDALMIGLLITCPAMRLGNLTMIRINQHLKRTSDGYRLIFTADETKTDKPLSISAPESLTPYMEYYLDSVRPVLLQSRDWDHLWITRYGEPMKSRTIYGRITTITKRAFGVSINPHLFRDCAVTTVAIDDPEHIGIAAPLLGHTDPRTTEKHYIQANALVAGRRLRKSVDALRKKLAPRRHRLQGDQS
jgi:integrase/recombinase XerD